PTLQVSPDRPIGRSTRTCGTNTRRNDPQLVGSWPRQEPLPAFRTAVAVLSTASSSCRFMPAQNLRGPRRLFQGTGICERHHLLQVCRVLFSANSLTQSTR